MIFHAKGGTLSLVLLMLGMLGVGQAHADGVSLENIRVRLPNGQVLTLGNQNTWMRDPRIRQYNRYYYQPQDRTYVVYDDRRPPAWGRVWNHRNDRDDNWRDNRNGQRGHGNGNGRGNGHR